MKIQEKWGKMKIRIKTLIHGGESSVYADWISLIFNNLFKLVFNILLINNHGVLIRT